jgi:hypothetical protein
MYSVAYFCRLNCQGNVNVYKLFYPCGKAGMTWKFEIILTGPKYMPTEYHDRYHLEIEIMADDIFKLHKPNYK